LRGVAFPTLEGSQIRVRPLRSGDRADLLLLLGDPETARYQSWSAFDEADADEVIAFASGGAVDVPGCWAQGVIAKLGDDRMIGDCSAHSPVYAPDQAAIGFNLMTVERGRGYAGEAIGLLSEWLLHERGKTRIFAVTDRRNQPSRRLLEKLGFRAVPRAYRIVYFKGEWEGEAVYEHHSDDSPNG